MRAVPTMKVIFKDNRHDGGEVRITVKDYDPELHESLEEVPKDLTSPEYTPEEIKKEAFKVFTELDADDYRQDGVPTVAGVNSYSDLDGLEFTGDMISSLWEEYQAQE